MHTQALDDKKIEVLRFGLIAEVVTPEQLETLGKDGYALTHGWSLNEEDYGPNQRYFLFELDV
jgi:hypothetical protein